MTDDIGNPALENLKHQARLLHRQTQVGDSAALDRMRKHPDFKGKPDDAIRENVKRRHALDRVAKETGFPDWPQAVQILEGKPTNNYGTALYQNGCSAHTNIWFASHGEARKIRDETGNYLLPYKNQFLVVDEHYISTLGLEPGDADWTLMGRDWSHPLDSAARSRLYSRLPAFRGST